MLIGRLPALGREGSAENELRHLRICALAIGTVAALLMVVVGCTSVTDGTAQVDAKEAPNYRASMSASVEASAETSSARESERRESLTTQAIRGSCDVLATSSVDSITAVNDFVGALNEGGSPPDVDAAAGAAVDTLNQGADVVAGSLTDPLNEELRGAINGWIDSSRAVSTAITADLGPDEFNAAITRFNEANDGALALCDALY